MKVVGIIAEYNPFHNGHLAQITYAKETLHADEIVVVMSGDFVQRGEPAILDKYVRTEMALLNGVDLVLQMPAVASTSSAEIFAKCGVAMLLSTGVVTDLIFGCEEETSEIFLETAKLFLEEPQKFKDVLSESLKAGDSFAKARAKALMACYEGDYPKEKLEDFLNGSNNILGIEYTKALLEKCAKVKIHPFKRYGTPHDSLSPSGKYASATLLRKSMITRSDISSMVSEYVPRNILHRIVEAVDEECYLEADDVSFLLHDRLLSNETLTGFLDVSPDLSDRILNLKDEFVSYSSFCDLLKTKNLNHSRIRRALIHTVLHITDSDLEALKVCDYVPYLRILGFNKRGAILLKTMKAKSNKMLFVSPNEVKEDLGESEKILFAKDIYASDLYRALITNKTQKKIPTEYTRKFEGNLL